MNAHWPIHKQGLLHLALLKLSRRYRENHVPEELQFLINECRNIQELLDLLFSTDWSSNEAIITAFDRRLDELVNPDSFSFFNL
jgi:hypothetical protein